MRASTDPYGDRYQKQTLWNRYWIKDKNLGCKRVNERVEKVEGRGKREEGSKGEYMSIMNRVEYWNSIFSSYFPPFAQAPRYS